MNKTQPVFQWMLSIALVLAGVFVLSGLVSGPAAAAPMLQLTAFPTPTPGPDGRILYTVQEGDTLWRIAAISGVPIEEIRALNNLSNDLIAPGKVLLLGLGGPAQATAIPAQATPTPAPSPTPDVMPETAEICVLVFDDLNGNTLRDVGEYAIVSSIISVSDRAGLTNLTADMLDLRDDFDDPLSECFPELPPGGYNITVAIPEGYNATTVLNYALQLDPGASAYLAFGAQASSINIAGEPVAEESGRSSTLGIVGVALILLGVGVGIAAMRMSRPKSFRPLQ